MKALSIGFFSTVIATAETCRSIVEHASWEEVRAFVDENFGPLAISLSTILAAEMIVVALLAR